MNEPKPIDTKDPVFQAIESSLHRQMVLTLFGTLIGQMENPLEFYKTFLTEWESNVAKIIQQDIELLEKAYKESGVDHNNRFAKALGIYLPDPMNQIEKSTQMIDFIKEAYLKPIHDKYSDK